MAIDYSARYSDYARFLPAVSEMYARFVSEPNLKRPMPTTQADLDFFNPASKLYYLPCVLYSAGQAAKTKAKASKKDMITGRTNPGTIVLGDSGGFQIQQGSIKWNGDETRDRLLGWLEENCDWSMILDFPTGSITDNTVKGGSVLGKILPPHTERLIKDNDTYVMEWHEFHKNKDGSYKRDASGKRIIKKTHSPKPLNFIEFADQIDMDVNKNQESGFATCLFQTLLNNVYFDTHRTPGKTKFLNVVQGRNIEESNIWYEQVKHFNFEGWSMAGPHKEKFDMTLTRLLAMRRDGLLENKNWMHVLGVGKLTHGCAYTTMQRMIRKHDNPDFTISYDVSSPFTSAAYGSLFYGYTLDKSGWGIHCHRYFDSYEYWKDGSDASLMLERSDPRMDNTLFMDVLKKIWDEEAPVKDHSIFVETEVGKLLRMKDICYNADSNLSSTWDVVTYAMMMNHNLQVHLEAVFDSQDCYDKGDKETVPYDLLILKELIEEILDPATANPEEVINKNKKALNCLAMELPNYQVFMDDAFQFDTTKPAEEEVVEPASLSIVDIFS